MEKYSNILTHEALTFLETLHNTFNSKRLELLDARKKIQQNIDKGEFPTFLEETTNIRTSDWKIDTIPTEVLDRRVEITGPVDAKMIINALNSGANVFMADFEDSNAPTFDNCIKGQQNLIEANLKTLSFTSKEGKVYKISPNINTILMVRPRGWHLNEANIQLGDGPTSASLVDFGLYFFHNYKTILAKNSHVYFYLPKLENHLEARLWNQVFEFTQNYFNLPVGTIRCTVLIETILATFELHEIIYELKSHIIGLNCGRWDYIFSYIKKFSKHSQFILPDRSQVTMSTPFMDAYSRFVVQTSHRRGIHAIGGMSAFIPIKNNPKANEEAFERVRQDKIREVKNGHDGTWVAHPGLIAVAKEVFDREMQTPNQFHILRANEHFNPNDFLECPKGTQTLEGLKNNVQVAILYIESWLRGVGAVAINNLMEDAATAEISRAQVWQWLRYQITLSNGEKVHTKLVQDCIESEIIEIQKQVGIETYEAGKYKEAVQILKQLIFNEEFEEFLTLKSYHLLNQ